LADADPELRPEYAKLWRSFVARRDAHRRDADLKSEARQRALALAHEKGVSRYRMARDLGLNDGNLHAFLAQGNVRKLSLERALALVRYLQNWSAENPSAPLHA
jgi:transposase-like protein